MSRTPGGSRASRGDPDDVGIQRGLRQRLEHDRAARGQHRGDLDHGRHLRVVPRRDGPTTPTGSRHTIVAPDGLGRGSSSATPSISSAYICSSPAGAAPLNADDSPPGMPFSRLTSVLVASGRAAARSRSGA
jgi:hypothetical protein